MLLTGAGAASSGAFVEACANATDVALNSTANATPSFFEVVVHLLFLVLSSRKPPTMRRVRSQHFAEAAGRDVKRFRCHAPVIKDLSFGSGAAREMPPRTVSARWRAIAVATASHHPHYGGLGETHGAQ
jgi:hypothetical protein